MCKQRETIMDKINDLYERISNGDDLDEVRNDIVMLIREILSENSDEISNWKKSHIASAIGSLSWNISQQLKSSDAWLRVCMMNIEKSLVPENERNDNSLSDVEVLNKITAQQLLEAISSL